MMVLTGRNPAITGTQLHPSRDVPDDPQVRASYVDDRVLWLGKQGFTSKKNKNGEPLCSRCLKPIGKDDTALFCQPCHDVLDGILAASRSSTSIPAVS